MADYKKKWPVTPLSDQEFEHTVEALASAVAQNGGGTWWEWSQGSSLAFWRWSGYPQVDWAINGLPIYVADELPQNQRPQRPLKAEVRSLVADKISKVLERGYIRPGPVSNLTDFFPVPKGENDVRIVYNGSSSGLNKAIWAPNFMLPTAETALRSLSYSSFMVDLDLGEMFLNFPMDRPIRPFAGVDLTILKNEIDCINEKDERWWFRWERLFMGMLSSPYNCIRYYYFAEEIARGPLNDRLNPCRFDRIRLNLPGSPSYNPSLPWVTKWNSVVEKEAGDVVTFVDDL